MSACNNLTYGDDKMDDLKTKSDIIVQLIKEKHWTLAEYSRIINIPYTTLLSILKNGIENATVGNVIKICDGLGISIDRLRVLTGEIPAPETVQLPADIADIVEQLNSNGKIRDIYQMMLQSDDTDVELMYNMMKRFHKD